MKRWRWALLTAVTLLAVLCCGAAAAASSGTCGAYGDNLTWVLDDDGTLTISGTGPMADYGIEWDIDYSHSSAPWCQAYTPPQTEGHEAPQPGESFMFLPRRVVIGDGVTGIGAYAFFRCDGLTEITIPDSVVSIGANAFDTCTRLRTVSIPGSVASIGSNAFESSGLRSVIMSDGVISIGSWAFAHTGIQSLSIPDSVTDIGMYAFEGSALENVRLPGGITVISCGMFANCRSLTDLTLPSDLYEIESSAFINCDSLTSLTIPAGVMRIGSNAFDDCGALSAFAAAEDNPAYMTLDGALYNKSCDTLIRWPEGKAEFSIPDTVTVIGDSAFSSHGITSIVIPDHVTSIMAGAFLACRSLTAVTLPDSISVIRCDVFSNCTALTEITIPAGVTRIESDAFFMCTSLSAITIMNPAITLGSEPFYNCNRLADIWFAGTRSQWEACSSHTDFSSGVTVHCLVEDGTCGDDLTWTLSTVDGTLTIRGSGPMDDYVTIGAIPWYAMHSTVLSVVIEPGVTRIGSRAFLSCENLRSLTISESVTEIGVCPVCGCRRLAVVYYGSGADDWSAIRMDDRGSCGHGTARVSLNDIEIVFGEHVHAWSDPVYVWSDDLSAVTATRVCALIPGHAETETVPVRRIADVLPTQTEAGGYRLVSAAFENVAFAVQEMPGGEIPALNTLDVPEFPAQLTTIGDGAFEGALFGAVIIPDTVTSIGSRAFADCPNLVYVYIPSGVTSVALDAFAGCPDAVIGRGP